MKRWIVPKNFYWCSTCYTEDTAKVETTHEDGTIDISCKSCKRRWSRKTHRYKDRRPCVSPDCLHIRDVTVSISTLDMKTETYQESCDACRLEATAASHQAQAKKFFDKAFAIRAARRGASGKVVPIT